jgi:GTPase
VMSRATDDALLGEFEMRKPRALARAISRAESGHGGGLVRALYAKTGRAITIGLTGPPGVGKSTLASALVRKARALGKTVGVVSVDPSSPFSRGALLGDRIRLAEHFTDEAVFIRSMASRGHLGGLAGATADAVLLMDAFGFDIVIIETVGVGQSEVEIAELAQTTLVALQPGSGDSIQVLKAGIMEIADVFVINKADQPGADKLDRELKSYLALSHRADGWSPKIVQTVASEGRGIAEVIEAAREYHARGSSRSRAAEIWAMRLREMLRERLLDRFPQAEFASGGREVAEHRRDPYSILDEWLERI